MSQSSEFAGSGRKRERSKTEGHVSCIHRSHPARRTHTLSERQIQYWQRRALAQEACPRSPCHRCRDSHQVHGQAESRAARSEPEPPARGPRRRRYNPQSKNLFRRNSPKQNAERIFATALRTIHDNSQSSPFKKVSSLLHLDGQGPPPSPSVSPPPSPSSSPSP